MKNEKKETILVEKEFSDDLELMEDILKMADYECIIRSNYFHVKDVDAYRDMIQNVSGDDFHSWEKTDDNGNPVFAFGCNGAIHGILHTGDSGPLDVDVSYPEFLDKLRKYVAEGDAVIISEIGHDKLRYLLGTAFIITSQWTESISLSDAAIETARKLLADPDYTTIMAN